jgi:hypothetical protein
VNKDAKILIKYLKNEFNSKLKRSYTMINLNARMVQHRNRIKDKNHMIISIDAEKSL